MLGLPISPTAVSTCATVGSVVQNSLYPLQYIVQLLHYIIINLELISKRLKQNACIVAHKLDVVQIKRPS